MNKEDILKELRRILSMADDTSYMWYYDENGVHEALLSLIEENCAHEWHADQDNQCNFCVKCGARQEIYTE